MEEKEITPSSNLTAEQIAGFKKYGEIPPPGQTSEYG
jgi:hypothetical protein|tara:strand:- start:43 stop:153 length:111 start_codon:yes stop_codon:yes gene_type:complete